MRKAGRTCLFLSDITMDNMKVRLRGGGVDREKRTPSKGNIRPRMVGDPVLAISIGRIPSVSHAITDEGSNCSCRRGSVAKGASLVSSGINSYLQLERIEKMRSRELAASLPLNVVGPNEPCARGFDS